MWARIYEGAEALRAVYCCLSPHPTDPIHHPSPPLLMLLLGSYRFTSFGNLRQVAHKTLSVSDHTYIHMKSLPNDLLPARLDCVRPLLPVAQQSRSCHPSHDYDNSSQVPTAYTRLPYPTPHFLTSFTFGPLVPPLPSIRRLPPVVSRPHVVSSSPFKPLVTPPCASHRRLLL
jgi:hypothetical protein